MNWSILHLVVLLANDWRICSGQNVVAMVLNSLSGDYRTKPTEDFVIFRCYQSNKPPVPVKVFLNDPKLTSKLNTSMPLGIFIHGYTEKYEDPELQLLMRDYIKYRESNFCFVDWSYLAALEYSLSANQTERVGNYTGDFIEYLLRHNYFSKNDILVSGFSLGAHIAGFVGARLKGILPLVIGLDPAGPGFTLGNARPIGKRLNPSVAQFVQVLHTDQNEFGSDQLLGHADFIPNGGGNPQPGCLNEHRNIIDFVACSHMRALSIFRASLNPSNRFVGHRCNSYKTFLAGNCGERPSDLFGPYSNNSVRGALYFQTTDTFPYL